MNSSNVIFPILSKSQWGESGCHSRRHILLPSYSCPCWMGGICLFQPKYFIGKIPDQGNYQERWWKMCFEMNFLFFSIVLELGGGGNQEDDTLPPRSTCSSSSSPRRPPPSRSSTPSTSSIQPLSPPILPRQMRKVAATLSAREGSKPIQSCSLGINCQIQSATHHAGPSYPSHWKSWSSEYRGIKIDC